jgi:hypothetical protein
VTRLGLVSAAALVVALAAQSAHAVTSTRSVQSAFGGNGHNVSFDGRLFIVRDGAGWQAMMLRPEGITFLPDGLPDAMGPMWSPRTLILGPSDVVENALAICEPDPSRAPFACDANGNPAAGGPFDCYDVIVIDSDAVTPPEMGGAVLRRRSLLVRVEDPKTANARVAGFTWGPSIQALSPELRGIEPTVTADGRLMIWQGHPANDGQIDILMYAVNDAPCGQSGWSAPRVISEMSIDPAVTGTYRLAERALRAADGTQLAPGDLVHGAYPWLMPNGDAVVFDASLMPCRGPEDPPGCGPRRNSFAVLGYPTNWGIAIVDGGVNPDTNETVRLFFSSPGPSTFAELPVTQGVDVWPFFGSNTSNYVELVFDDGLDGTYAGLWHLNESVDADGNLDTTRTPDVSGYFNTAALRGGMTFALANDGVVGKALTFDGIDDHLEVPSSQSLNPVNGITIDLWIRPDPIDCDGNNNYRLLLGKGNIGDGSYTIVLEENLSMQARVRVGGAQQSVWSPPLVAGVWTHVSFEYDGPTGQAGWWFDDAQVASQALPPGTIDGSTYPLTIGAPGPRAACPNGDGAFPGRLDEVSISRAARRLGTPVEPTPDAGVDPGDPDGGGPGPGDPDASGGGGSAGGATGGCGCRAGGGTRDGGAAVLIILLLAAVRTAARARTGRRS